MDRQPNPKSVLVVCFGNLCRSPMAEGLLRHRLDDSWDVASAGTNAYGGDQATDLAIEAMERERGIDIGWQRSTPLTVGSIQRSGHVFTMSVQQAHLAAALAPDASSRIRLFGSFAPANDPQTGSADPGGPAAGPLEIVDPMGSSYTQYVLCLERLDLAAEHCVEWLVAGADDNAGPPAVGSPHGAFARDAR